MSLTTNPSATIVVREHHGRPFYEAKFRHRARQVKRRIGPAWLELDKATGEWRRRRGRVPDGMFDERAQLARRCTCELRGLHMEKRRPIGRGAGG